MGASDSETTVSDDLVDRVATLNRPAVLRLTAVDARTEHEMAAVLIGSTGIAVTVANGLSPSQELSAHDKDGTAYQAGLVVIDRPADVAVLKVKGAERLEYALPGDPCGLREGDSLVVIDDVAGRGTRIGRTAVIEMDVSESGWRYIGIEASPIPFQDGAPVFDRKGNLVALVSSRRDDDASSALSIRRAVPINALFGHLDQLGVSSASQRLTERGKRAADADEKVPLFEAAVRADPSNSTGWFYLAVAYGDQGETGKQIRALERFAELRPDSFQAHRNLGLAYMNMKKLDRALDHLVKSVELRPKAARAHNDLGEVYRRRKMYTEARKEFKTALSLDPDLAEAHFNLGVLTATVDNDAVVAARHFHRYLDLRPGTPDAGKIRRWMDGRHSRHQSKGQQQTQ